MNYHIICSKCPSLAGTHVCCHLKSSFTVLSMAFSGKAAQINWSASLNSATDFGFGCSLW